jgi:diguanylate cyclase (GGDEF)-like protein
LYNVSRIDPITKLLNRRALENSLELILERRRKSDQHCALLFIDLDRFKYINDTHGHRAGDALLSVVAERLTNELRAADVIGRWGGDELVILLEEGDAQAIDNLIVRLRKAINLPVMFGNTELRVGASVGCAIFPDDGATLETLLYIADIRMYQDKQRHYT